MTRNHARRTDARARDAAARSPHATSPSPSLAPSVVPGPSGSNYALVEESDSDEYDAGPSSSKKRKPRKAKGKAAKKGKVEDDDKEWEEVWVDLGEDQEESDGDDDRVDENEPAAPAKGKKDKTTRFTRHGLPAVDIAQATIVDKPHFDLRTVAGIEQYWTWFTSLCSKPELIPAWERRLRHPDRELHKKIAASLRQLWEENFGDFPLDITHAVFGLEGNLVYWGAEGIEGCVKVEHAKTLWYLEKIFKSSKDGVAILIDTNQLDFPGRTDVDALGSPKESANLGRARQKVLVEVTPKTIAILSQAATLQVTVTGKEFDRLVASFAAVGREEGKWYEVFVDSETMRPFGAFLFNSPTELACPVLHTPLHICRYDRILKSDMLQLNGLLLVPHYVRNGGISQEDVDRLPERIHAGKVAGGRKAGLMKTPKQQAARVATGKKVGRANMLSAQANHPEAFAANHSANGKMKTPKQQAARSTNGKKVGAANLSTGQANHPDAFKAGNSKGGKKVGAINMSTGRANHPEVFAANHSANGKKTGAANLLAGGAVDKARDAAPATWAAREARLAKRTAPSLAKVEAAMLARPDEWTTWEKLTSGDEAKLSREELWKDAVSRHHNRSDKEEGDKGIDGLTACQGGLHHAPTTMMLRKAVGSKKDWKTGQSKAKRGAYEEFVKLCGCTRWEWDQEE